MTSRFEFQAQVEYDLGRPLTEPELQEVPSLDQLTDEQIAVAAAIRRHHYITPMVYVKAIVPTADHADVRKFLDEDIERIAVERMPPEELPNQQLFEHYAGRPLRPMERVRVESFEKMSNEQIELARTLSRADPATGFLYLSRIVPGESIERRHELAKHLAVPMPIDLEEVDRALEFSNRRVFPYTDCVLVVQADGRARLASCVLLEVDGRNVAVTCAHVLRADAKYFIGPNRLEQDRVPDDPGPPVPAARMLGRNEDADLALFDIPDDEPQRRGKASYHLHHAEPLTEARVASQLKTAAFICGIFGDASRALQYPDGLVYTQLPFYAGIGPIESCTSTQIIADFAEKAILHKADDIFPQLRDVEPTNGVRELGGISGSGLWVKSGEEMYLAGIVLGRAASTEGQHLVRVTPVWVLRSWVRTVLSGQAGS